MGDTFPREYANLLLLHPFFNQEDEDAKREGLNFTIHKFQSQKGAQVTQIQCFPF
jgi:hypothetical protein